MHDSVSTHGLDGLMSTMGINCQKDYWHKNFGSGALVRIIENNKIDAYFSPI